VHATLVSYYGISFPFPRREDVTDLSDLDQEAVEKVANDIEEKLHNLYQDINPKYKNKYRSLLFNLKDTRNQVRQAEKKAHFYILPLSLFLTHMS
jgi:gas vesicle protein